MPPNWQPGTRTATRALAAALSLLVIALVPAAAPPRPHPVLALLTATDPAVAEQLRSYQPLLLPRSQSARPLPADPGAALTSAVENLSAQVGFAQDAVDTIQTAGLSPDVAGRLALLLSDMTSCHTITTRYRAELFGQLSTLFRDRSGLAATDFPDVLPCGIQVRAALGELESALDVARGPAGADGCRSLPAERIDLWPVLRIEPECEDHTYRNDYLLIVDLGGDDIYHNNAGSNVIDVNYSPPGAAVTGLIGSGPARGCQRGLTGLFLDDCYLSAALLLDLHGDDMYGVLESPEHDRLCTRDPVIRRMLTGGAAVLGVGILRDAGQGHDRYTGKTVSLGASHLFGVGILSDDGGDDTYLAVRNSQGFALLGGVGILHDASGDDTYDYYMPAAIDPTAPNQADGAGGVRDNEGDGTCDHVPRYTLGAANLLSNAVGILVDESGDDNYRGAFADSYVTTPAIPGMRLVAGSLGYGANDALGVFLDGGGRDVYRVDDLPAGLPVRMDKAVIRPGEPAMGQDGRGLFVDR